MASVSMAILYYDLKPIVAGDLEHGERLKDRIIRRCQRPLYTKRGVRTRQQLSDLDVSWFEEPVSSDYLDGLRLLRGRNADCLRRIRLLPYFERGTAQRRKLASENLFHVCILVNLPDTTGYDLLGRLLQIHNTNRPITIAVTGFGRAEDTDCVRQAGSTITW
jgi:hypothetical protein